VSLNIRPASEADWTLLEQTYVRYLDELPTEPGDTDDSMTWLRRQFDLSLKGERYIWFAYDDEQFIGFTMFAVFENSPGSSKKYGVMMDFYIVPEGRQHGIGHELARAAFSKMRTEGASIMELNVLRENQRAFNFWQSLGLHVHHHVMKMALDK
jgi:ribosomal protein S18 acetylase RimI-like enzyme